MSNLPCPAVAVEARVAALRGLIVLAVRTFMQAGLGDLSAYLANLRALSGALGEAGLVAITVRERLAIMEDALRGLADPDVTASPDVARAGVAAMRASQAEAEALAPHLRGPPSADVMLQVRVATLSALMIDVVRMMHGAGMDWRPHLHESRLDLILAERAGTPSAKAAASKLRDLIGLLDEALDVGRLQPGGEEPPPAAA